MSLINKMLKDLEKRGVTPSMAFGNLKESNEEPVANAEHLSDNTQVESDGSTATKKQPSRLIIYSLLFLAIYLAAYGWVSYKGGNIFKQLANPLQAQQYQPKPITPLHTSNSTAPQTRHAPTQARNLQMAQVQGGDVESEIRAAIQAELNQANGANEEAVEEILSEAEAVRQAQIQKALAAKVANANTTTKGNIQPPVQTAVPKPTPIAPVTVKQASTPTPPAPQKVASAETKKAKPVSKPVEIQPVKATVAPAPKLAKAAVSTKPVATNRPTRTAKTNVSTPKIVKKVRAVNQSEAMYQKALRYVQQGRVSEAQTVLSNALDIDPAHQDARQTLAALLLDNQRIKAAKNVLQDGLVVNPNNVAFRMAVARLEVEMGQPSLALDTLMTGNQKALNHAEYQAFIGTLLQAQNRHAEAITHFQNALNINRGMSNVLIGMGVSYQALNRLDDAKMAYQQAQSNTRLPNNLKDFLNYRIKEVDQKISVK